MSGVESAEREDFDDGEAGVRADRGHRLSGSGFPLSASARPKFITTVGTEVTG
jgi:hypothetical protein